MKRLIALGLACGLLAVGVPNLIVWLGGRSPVTTDTAKVPHAQAALILGAQVYRDGKPSIMLADRVTAGAELYKAGRVDKLLLSGDHSRKDYDEVGTMRRLLLAQGIPAQDIFTDHAGFDTWDSAQRARRVFDVQSAVVVTQKFHMARALYDARRAGLKVTGYAADRRDYGRVMRRLEVREAAARVKTLGDAITGANPHFLGTEIPITGDGRVSWGD
ncbi:YdcF family protein [Solirubrobacter ginsenosidimutans]|uniref:YdcF family protein n=1 Tax=Solirubrobacter ginsenosidimutans TaxID=490573 RepID=A0A9X3S601_9ACTN|nr:ElyC/SanA/YdcF family protein [Solirubrobacter ginsenosidimutans]MDA0166127.1 YdcF family protein [Solirubrobacter ginsenosidimutans]